MYQQSFGNLGQAYDPSLAALLLVMLLILASGMRSNSFLQYFQSIVGLVNSLNLQGPCVSIDTACSSSLVTLHFAIRCLRHENCTAAVSAGVNLPMNWETSSMFVGAAMTSADGRCKTLDSAADGYVRSEACAALKLR